MRVFLILLRVGVLLLALLGVAATGVVAYIWWSDFNKMKPEIETARKRMAAARTLSKMGLGDARSAQAQKDSAAAFETMNKIMYATAFLMVAVVLGLFGGVLAVMGRTNCAAVLLLLSALGPPLLEIRSLLPVSPLILGGLGSFFVSFLAFVTRPKPRPDADFEEEDEPARGNEKSRSRYEDEEEERDEPPARGSGKRKDFLDEEEDEEWPVKASARRESDVIEEEVEEIVEEIEEEIEIEEPPAKKSAKRKSSSEEDEEPEPPTKAGSKRKRS